MHKIFHILSRYRMWNAKEGSYIHDVSENVYLNFASGYFPYICTFFSAEMRLTQKHLSWRLSDLAGGDVHLPARICYRETWKLRAHNASARAHRYISASFPRIRWKCSSQWECTLTCSRRNQASVHRGDQLFVFLRETYFKLGCREKTLTDQ